MLLQEHFTPTNRLNLHASDGLFLHIVRHIKRGADGGHQAVRIGFARPANSRPLPRSTEVRIKGRRVMFSAFAETGVPMSTGRPWS